MPVTIPNTIWAKDADGNPLPWGKPNFDKPGVTEAVNRLAFYGEENSCANRGTLPVVQLARINRFEDEIKGRK